MSVFRINKNNNYTTISNYRLHDLNLSLKAKELLSFVKPSKRLGLFAQRSCRYMKRRSRQNSDCSK